MKFVNDERMIINSATTQEQREWAKGFVATEEFKILNYDRDRSLTGFTRIKTLAVNSNFVFQFQVRNDLAPTRKELREYMEGELYNHLLFQKAEEEIVLDVKVGDVL
jgi:hypothetical protein